MTSPQKKRWRQWLQKNRWWLLMLIAAIVLRIVAIELVLHGVIPDSVTEQSWRKWSLYLVTFGPYIVALGALVVLSFKRWPKMAIGISSIVAAPLALIILCEVINFFTGGLFYSQIWARAVVAVARWLWHYERPVIRLIIGY